MPSDARHTLAEQQAALVRALAMAAPAPQGFCGQSLRTAAQSLVHKRCRAVVKAWPRLAHAMGDSFGPRFFGYAAQAPAHADGPAAEGRAFAHWLDAQGLLPAACRVDLSRSIAMGGFPVRTLVEDGSLIVIWRFAKQIRELQFRLPGNPANASLKHHG